MRMMRPRLDAVPIPATPKKAWLLIVAGAIGCVLGVLLSMIVGGWFFVLTLAAGVTFALGVAGLADRGWWMLLPAFVISVFGPAIWAVQGHDAVMSLTGQRDICAVERAETGQGARRSVHIDYTLACPNAGRVQLRLSYSEQAIQETTTQVLYRSPFKPVFADRLSYHGPLLATVPVAMAVLVIVAAGVRRP